MKKILKRKLLLTEKQSPVRLVGYARAIKEDSIILNDQMQSLIDYGCGKIFFETIGIDDERKPELEKAFNFLSRGDEFVISSLNIVFKSKSEFITKIIELVENSIHLRTLTGFSSFSISPEIITCFFNILFEIDTLERQNLDERKKIINVNRSLNGINFGGRPKISNLKANLVIRLRNEGCSYRSIRSQTGLALSTIRRVILDSEAEKI